MRKGAKAARTRARVPAEQQRGRRLLLLSMPFGALERPALGLSLLKPAVEACPVECDVRYLNFEFAELIGLPEYQFMSFELPYTAFAGDWAFAESLYGERPEEDAHYLRDVLRSIYRLSDDEIRRILRARAMARHYLDHCMAAVSWNDYFLVGFTSTFEQNIASLALAKRIKAAFPHLIIVFGGANWEGEMGVELHRQFTFVDYVCSGEADDSFPSLVRALAIASPEEAGIAAIPGIVYRAGTMSVASGPPMMLRDLDRLPIPDYSDYFAAVTNSTVGASLLPTLLLETARGCWWGAKSHCTFCGLNGGSMAFRSKSPARVLSELEYLVDRWRIDLVEAVDNILDMKYFTTVLPALANARRKYHLFYETKANLNREQVRLLRDAGVRRIQPGIESMSDHVLALMRKGTGSLRNIQLLKWCREYGIKAEWNLLYGFPGETVEDYVAMIDVLRAIRFLGAPGACAPIRLDRFSPFHEAPEKFGFARIRPIAAYDNLYPFAPEVVARIAYYFDYDYAEDCDPRGHAACVVDFVDQWQRNPETGTLMSVRDADGSLMLIDSRSDAHIPELRLSGREQAVYEFCDQLRSYGQIIAHLETNFSDFVAAEMEVGAFLGSLIEHHLMVTDGAHYLSLAVAGDPARSSHGSQWKQTGLSAGHPAGA